MIDVNFEWQGKSYTLTVRNFEDFHGITLVSMSLNEEEYIVDFYKQLRPYVDTIVLVDSGSKDLTIDYAYPFVDILKTIPFTGHHGNQKNRAIELVTTDWILFLDQDEMLSKEALLKLRDLIEQDEYDCYSFPRKEIRDGKEDKNVYPDYQDRLFRSYCRYVRPIHIDLVGFKKRKILPQNDIFDIIHTKSEKRHKTRNSIYEHIERHIVHEMTYPGCQLRASSMKKYPLLFQDTYEKFIVEMKKKNV